MATFKIRSPWWKENAVGLAERDMTDEMLYVDILYKDKNGKRKWPKTYKIPRSVATRCKIKIAKNGLMLRVVPISMLQEID